MPLPRHPITPDCSPGWAGWVHTRSLHPLHSLRVSPPLSDADKEEPLPFYAVVSCAFVEGGWDKGTRP